MEEFYWSYMIDPTDIACGKVIYVRCDWVHEYKNVCELFDLCNFDWPEINWCSMIPGINANQPWIPNPHPGRILWVNWTNSCVERLDPTNLFACADELVKASSTDPTAGYLEDKLGSSDWSVIINLLAGWSIIDLTVNLPNTPTIPDPTNACANGSFLMASGWAYGLVCDHSDLYCTKYLPADTSFSITANTVAYPLINWFVAQWNAAMVISWWSPVTDGIKITESGMYRVWMNVWVKIDPSVNAIRFMIRCKNPSEVNKTLLLNAKDAVYPTGTAIVRAPETFKGISMSETGLYRLDAWSILTMVCRVDSDNLPAGTIVVEWQWIIEWTRWSTGQVATTYCWTQFWVCRYPGKRRWWANPVL